MRKKVVLFTLIMLFLLPALYSPQNPSLSVDAPAIGNESFVTAADSDESSESITSFSKTLDDDVLFYPDAFLNDTVITASSDTSNITDGGSYETTQVKDGSYWYSTGLAGYFNLNFTVPSTVEYFNLAVYMTLVSALTCTLNVYDWTADEWINFDSYSDTGWTWKNYTLSDPDYFNENQIAIQFFAADGLTIGIDYAEVTNYVMTLADANHYAQSFVDVSDWAEFETEDAGDIIATDGDVLNFSAVYSGSGTEKDGIFTDDISISVSGSYYVEFSYSMEWNSVIGPYLILYDQDGRAGTSQQINIAASATAKISKTLITLNTIESISIYCYTNDPADYLYFYADYLRIFPSDESGYQHDGSTTVGVTGGNGGTLSTDGDNLTCIDDGDGSVYDFYIDTTATKAYLEPNYYQFVEIKFSTGNSYFRMDSSDENDVLATVFAYTEQGSTTLFRANLDANENGQTKFLRLTSYAGYDLVVDYLEVYSIANYTIAQGSVGTDEYYYVDSGTLYIQKDTTNWMTLDHDPALSVAVATYPVWNITSSDIDPRGDAGTSISFQPKVGGFLEPNTDESRGDYTGSGTLTDVYMIFYANELMDISAIKFIKDGTAPEVVRSSSTPNDPEDDETITLSAVITDAVEVYKVYFDAIVYPAGFSDSAYYATESSDNFWYYEFSSLQNGYYCFKIQATDGANTNELTEYAYLTLNVREAAIIVEEITLIGAGEDFTMMTFSARINRNCTYTIYEESASSPEADTSTGSVTAPSFNLAWEKLDIDDSNVNFTIIFVSGTLSLNYTSQYQVKQITDRIKITTYTLFGASSDFTYMHYSGYITHDCTFTIQEWSDSWAKNETHSGSVSAGDFNIAWDKIGVNDIDANYTITFTNGSLTLVVDGSYITAYKLLRITDIDYINLESSDSWVTNLTVNFYANKDVDWYIYDRDDNDAVLISGSSVEGSDAITWKQNTTRGAHFFAVKWTDGVESIWYNSSYWIYDKNIDELPVGGDLVDKAEDDVRKTITMWATIGAIISFVGLLVLGIQNSNLKDEMKKLQLPHYETQEGADNK